MASHMPFQRPSRNALKQECTNRSVALVQSRRCAPASTVPSHSSPAAIAPLSQIRQTGTGDSKALSPGRCAVLWAIPARAQSPVSLYIVPASYAPLVSSSHVVRGAAVRHMKILGFELNSPGAKFRISPAVPGNWFRRDFRRQTTPVLHCHHQAR